MVSSKDSVEEVLKGKAEIEQVLAEGSMFLHKWNSNSVVLKGLFVTGDESCPDLQTVLGMIWEPKSDTLHVNSSRILKSLGHRDTKEKLHSVIAQVSDPMGLLSPFVFVAKRLLQKQNLRILHNITLLIRFWTF